MCLAVLGYFAYHAQTGRYSIHTQANMEYEAAKLEVELAALKIKRQKLALKVSYLTNGSLEKDALDEEARKILGYSTSDEIIILYWL